MPPDWQGPELDLLEIDRSRESGHLPERHRGGLVVYADANGQPLCARCATFLYSRAIGPVAAYHLAQPTPCVECGHEIPR